MFERSASPHGNMETRAGYLPGVPFSAPRRRHLSPPDRCPLPRLQSSNLSAYANLSALRGPHRPGVRQAAYTRRRRPPAILSGEFAKVRDSREQYKGKWNWAAFLFGPIWGFVTVCRSRA
jgi:hypothetical protein